VIADSTVLLPVTLCVLCGAVIVEAFAAASTATANSWEKLCNSCYPLKKLKIIIDFICEGYDKHPQPQTKPLRTNQTNNRNPKPQNNSKTL
jgi:hypothetical protein